MPAAVGDVLGIQCVWLPSGFGGAEPPEPEPTPVPTLRGVPSAIPKPRKRPDVAEISGVGYVSVLGSRTITGEACSIGELLQAVDLSGELVRDVLRFLVGAIAFDSADILSGEAGLSSLVFQMQRGAAIGVSEMHMSATGVVVPDGAGRGMLDQRMIGLGRIRSGGVGRIREQENDEDWIVAAGSLIARLLTRSNRKA